MKNTKLILVYSSTLFLLLVVIKSKSIISEIRYVNRIVNASHITHSISRFKDYYEQYGNLPQSKNDIEKNLPEFYYLNLKYLKNIDVSSKNRIISIFYSPQNNIAFKVWNRCKWKFNNTNRLGYYDILSFKFSEPPLIKYRFYDKKVEDKETIKEKLNERISKKINDFNDSHAEDNFYIYENTVSITFYYSANADNYFYHTNDYRIDSISDVYLFNLKYAIKDILKSHGITEIQIPVNLPKYSPVPPPFF